MARIKGGTFKRGSTFNETKEYLKLCRKTDRTCQLWWFEDELPQKLIELDSFWIDIYEVTNARYLEFVQATGHRPALDDSCQTAKCREGNLWDEASFPPQIRNQPVTQVNWYDADTYCAWMGKRLPSEAEWEKAARGVDSRKWPWIQYFDHPNNGFSGFQPEPVDKREEWISPYGLYGMGHNVWEWTQDWYAYKGQPNAERNKFKVIRGGLIQTHLSIKFSATYFRNWMEPTASFNFTGFRCSRDAQ